MDRPTRVLAVATIRSRWWSLVSLGVLAGLAAGLAVAAISGGLRSGSALDRLRERINAADATVFPSQVGLFQPDWTALESRPEVKAVARWGLLFGEFGPEVPAGLSEGGAILFPSIDGTYLGEVGRPVVVEGRMYDPEADDEIVIDEHVVDAEVGDVLPFTSYSVEQVTSGEEGPPAGRHTDFRVVGRVRTLAEFTFVPNGQILASPGAVASPGDDLALLENADIQLRDPDRDLGNLQRWVDEDLQPGTPVIDLHEYGRRVETSTDVERTALIILGAIIALAGIVLVGQAVIQSASAAVDEHPTLRALGMTRRNLTAMVVVAHTPTALVAGVVAVVTAVVGSLWFPVGTAARIDPDRGAQVTWTVLVVGVAAVVLALVGAAAVVAAARARLGGPRRIAAPGRVLSWMRRQASVPIGLGATMALSPRRGGRQVPVTQALVGAVVGVLGVVATLTLQSGLNTALDHPERAGMTWDALLRPPLASVTPDGVDPELTDAVAATPGVQEIAVADRQAADVGGVGVPVLTVRPVDDSPEPPFGLALVSGRAPQATDEAAIGPRTADDLDLDIGDTVSVAGQDAVIVGTALFPAEVHSAFDEGVWLNPAGFDARLEGPDESGNDERIVAIRFAPGTNPEDGLRALEDHVGDLVTDGEPMEPPSELSNLENIRTLPNLLAAIVALLAIGSIGHVLATSARRQRHDFAVLRAMGLTRRGTRVVLNAQGTTIGLVGLVIGVPLGIAAGRWGWAYIGSRIPLEVVRPLAVAAVLLLFPLALAVANALALWPGFRVGRLRPGEVLRTE